ncbi:hypothetical protein JWZ98_10155 [Methylomonas sp. EFPC1]|nr:hypothetical protein [Methylomonas sp. EFPC1]QSB03255.1 hypothetical protein JWZ98_10155 [Methylomonas sp. EFPC1]
MEADLQKTLSTPISLLVNPERVEEFNQRVLNHRDKPCNIQPLRNA